MTNLIQFNSEPTTNPKIEKILSPLERRGIFFNVGESELFMQDQTLVPDKKAVINTDNGKYVATVGTDYVIIPNKQIYNQFAHVLANSNIDTTGMKTKVRAAGPYTKVDFEFPAHQISIDGRDDLINLMISTVNSYDGRFAFTIEIGGFRLLCSNGMGIGELINCFSTRHVSKYDQEKMSSYLSSSIETFVKSGKYWTEMRKVEVEDVDALASIKTYLKVSSELSPEEVLAGKNTTLKKAFLLWEEYKNKLGKNKWAIYNTITHLSTHFETKGNEINVALRKKSDRDRVFKSAQFRKLKAA